MLPFFGKNTDGGICKCFPAAVLMGAGLMGTYGESGIEQQYALFRPTGQVAGRRRICSDIRFDLFKNID